MAYLFGDTLFTRNDELGPESLTCMHHMACIDIGHESDNEGFRGTSRIMGTLINLHFNNAQHVIVKWIYV